MTVQTALSFTIHLSQSPPTGNARLHWSARARAVKAIRASAYLQALSYRNAYSIPPVDKQRRRVVLTLDRGACNGRRRRLVDTDAVYAALKPCLDGLKDAGLIHDDSVRWCDYRAEQTQSHHPGVRVFVSIEDIA